MTPYETGTPKLYACKPTFQKAKFLTVEYLDSSHHRIMDFISSMGATPLRTETLKFYACKPTFQKAKFLTVEYLDNSHHRMMDFISCVGGSPRYKR